MKGSKTELLKSRETIAKQYFLDNVRAGIGINPDLHNSLFLS